MSLIDYTAKRRNMLRIIKDEVRFTQDYLGKSELSPDVIAAMDDVPRHEFVPKSMQTFAYANEPLYIGHGQTISQPYIVAIMTDLISPSKDHSVLDIGTGSGYQAAVLSKLVKTVYSVEIIDSLALAAIDLFQQLHYDNIKVKIGDGYEGWSENAPYDGIVVAATAPYVPTALVDQLKPGGKLILPVGHTTMGQELVLVEKDTNGEITTNNVLPVSFVPLVSNSSYSEE